METFENFMVSIGMGSPLARGTVGAALFSIPIFMHWSISYQEVENGLFIPKKWSFFSSPDSKVPTTGFPWWIWPIFGYALFALFL